MRGDIAWAGRIAPALFLVFCLAGALFLAWNLPPFMAADEQAHLHRAELTTLGRFTAERIPYANRLVAGGPSSAGIGASAKAFNEERFSSIDKADVADFEGAVAKWDTVKLQRFPGAALYPPFLYLPQSAGIAIGKLLNAPVVQTLYLARVANALASAAIGALALTLFGRARLYVFTILLLPMALSLYGSASPDALALALTALGCGVIARAMSAERGLSLGELIVAGVCFALVAMTKVPFVLMTLALLAVPTDRPRVRIAVVAAVFLLGFGWAGWMAAAVQTPLIRGSRAENPDVGAQLRFLLGQPAVVLTLAAETLKQQWRFYAESFIGQLGWLNLFLPRPFHAAAWAVIAAAGLTAISTGRAAGWRRLPWVVLASSVLIAGGVFLALYLAWTPPGRLVVEGVQGRYFLPLAVFLALALEGPRAPRAETRPLPLLVERGVTLAVFLLPLAALPVIERALVLRYYLD